MGDSGRTQEGKKRKIQAISSHFVSRSGSGRSPAADQTPLWFQLLLDGLLWLQHTWAPLIQSPPFVPPVWESGQLLVFATLRVALLPPVRLLSPSVTPVITGVTNSLHEMIHFTFLEWFLFPWLDTE